MALLFLRLVVVWLGLVIILLIAVRIVLIVLIVLIILLILIPLLIVAVALLILRVRIVLPVLTIRRLVARVHGHVFVVLRSAVHPACIVIVSVVFHKFTPFLAVLLLLYHTPPQISTRLTPPSEIFITIKAPPAPFLGNERRSHYVIWQRIEAADLSFVRVFL